MPKNFRMFTNHYNVICREKTTVQRLFPLINDYTAAAVSYQSNDTDSFADVYYAANKIFTNFSARACLFKNSPEYETYVSPNGAYLTPTQAGQKYRFELQNFLNEWKYCFQETLLPQHFTLLARNKRENVLAVLALDRTKIYFYILPHTKPPINASETPLPPFADFRLKDGTSILDFAGVIYNQHHCFALIDEIGNVTFAAMDYEKNTVTTQRLFQLANFHKDNVKMLFSPKGYLAIHDETNQKVYLYNLKNKELSELALPPIKNLRFSAHGGFLSALAKDQSNPAERLLYMELAPFKLNKIAYPKPVTDFVIGYLGRPCLAIDNKIIYFQYLSDLKAKDSMRATLTINNTDRFDSIQSPKI